MIQTPSLLQRFFTGAFWTSSGTILSQIFGMAGAVIAGRLLGKDSFGELGLIRSTLNIFYMFAVFGIGLTATKYISELRHTNTQRIGSIIGFTRSVNFVFSLLGGLIIILGASFFTTYIVEAPHLRYCFMLGGAVVILQALLNGEQGILSGFQDFKSVAQLQIIQPLFQCFFYTICIYFWGVIGAVGAIALALVVPLLSARKLVADHCRRIGVKVNYAAFRIELPVFWAFSLPVVLTGILEVTCIWAVHTWLATQQGGFGELGLFTAANNWRAAITFFPTIIGGVMVPLLAEVYGTGQQQKFGEVLRANILLNWGVGLSLTFLGIVLSSWLMGWYGPEFRKGGQVMAIILCASFLQGAHSPIRHALIGAGRMWHSFFMHAGWNAVLLASAQFLLPVYGAAGLSSAYLCAYMVLLLSQLLYIKIKLHVDLGRNLLALITLSLGAVFLAFYSHVMAFWKISLFVALCLNISLSLVWRAIPQSFKEQCSKTLAAFYCRLSACRK